MMKLLNNYNIGVVGLNHKTSTLETREALSFSPARREEALKILKRLYPLNEYVILSTCNRVEIYIGSKEEINFYDIIDFLSSYHNVAKKDIIHFGYIYSGEEAIAHLFEVAGGIDSLVIGETQVLGQMKNSYRQALELGSTGKVLNMAFQKAFAVGKKVRTQTKINDGNVSISSISCQLAVEVLKDLKDKKVLLVGAGKIGTLTLKSLRDKGARTILVSSRSYERARALAEEFDGKAVTFDKLEDFMVKADLVISATSAPHYILKKDTLKRIMKKRGNRPILLIDLAVPRDIDPLISEIQNVQLYNIDSLESMAKENMKKREKEVFQCRNIIAKEIGSFIRQIKRDSEERDDRLFSTLISRERRHFPPALHKEKSPCYSLESGIQV